MTESGCSIGRTTLAGGLTAITLSTPALAVTVLPDKGADIYSLVHRATGTDILWKSPIGLRAPGQGRLSADSMTAWLEMYEGGWQECLPNGGDPCVYRGVELNFHGESTTLPWNVEVVREDASGLVVDFSVRLFRSPFHLRRRMILNASTSALQLQETVTNLGAEVIEFMWGHHPAIGAPFLSAETRLDTSARTIHVDDSYDAPFNALVPGEISAWPHVSQKDGALRDLRFLPGEADRCNHLMYLLGFGENAWYTLVNPNLPLGVGVAWSPEVFQCLWLWQEVHATLGFPFYGQAYTVAVEPWSSYPGSGLVKVLDTTRSHLTLGPGASLSSILTVTLFEPVEARGVERVALDGTIVWKGAD